MNINPDIARMVSTWAGVNIAACVVLAVMSYVSSVFILDWLEALDRRLSTPRERSDPREATASDDTGEPSNR